MAKREMRSSIILPFHQPSEGDVDEVELELVD
jgi:hypothetical protein